MTRFKVVFAILAILAGQSAQAATKYFDVNADTPGSGIDDQGGPYVWDTTATNWSTSAAGDVAPVAWVNGDDAIFAAGNDFANEYYGLDVKTGVTANTVQFKAGSYVTMKVSTAGISTTGDLTVGEGIGQGAIFEVGPSPTTMTLGTGKFVLKGGTYQLVTNQTVAHSILATTKPFEINGQGTINCQETGTNRIAIYGGAAGTITGTGGTTSNGGAGTLIIAGDPTAEIRYQGVGLPNTTYAKLKVTGPLFRLGFANSTQDERGFGAVPTSLLPDAITLDGGGIGLSFSTTTNANRGITVTTNGGYFNGNGAGTLTVPGPITANGGTLTIFGRNLTTTSTTYGRSSAGLTLSNSTNVSTFQNANLIVDSSTLTLNESLNAASLNGGSTTATGGVGTGTPVAGNAQATATGTITIAANKVFTVGSGNTNMSYSGRVTGSGSVTKVGSGELLLNTVRAQEIRVPTDPAYNGGTPIVSYTGEWQNTGGVNINDGSIKFGNGDSGFATTNPVTIGATGKLNMNGINDTFGSLAGPAGGIVDMKDAAATPGNLTFGATSGTTTYSGTIVGGGNLTKAGTASTAVQILAGNSTLGTVSVTNGSLINNAAMTTTGGVTVAAGATLGGTGSIGGAIGNTGIISPGSGGVGTLSVTGNVTDNAASSWSIDLSGATADKLAVTGNIDLTAADTLNVTGAGTGSSWIIGTYTGTQTGVFDTITSGYTVSYSGGNITLNAVPVGVPGDFNGDNKVDAADYVFIRKATPDITSGTGLTNYNLWRANFGTNNGSGSGSGLGSSAVPEPTSIVLLLSSLGFVAVGRRRSR